MAKCISCGKEGAQYNHYNGGKVCKECAGKYFTCPSCGILYDLDDYEHGDSMIDGKCVKCSREES